MDAELSLSSQSSGVSCTAPCAFLSYRRQFGRETKWAFDVEAAARSKVSRELARALRAGRCFASVSCVSDERLKISPDVRVSVVNRSDEDNSLLHIEGTSTNFGSATKGRDPSGVRFRVHRVADLAQLFRRFDRFLDLSNYVVSVLQKFKVADESKSCVIQNGVSDWTFVEQLLGQYGALQNPLFLTPSPEENRNGGRCWRLVWNTIDANQKAELMGKPVEWLQSDGEVYEHFDSLGPHQLGCACPPLALPSVGVHAPHREFEPGRWNKWRQNALPVLSSGSDGLVWKIRDEILFAGVSTPVWSSWVSEISPGTDLVSTSPVNKLPLCMCTGVVTNSTPKDPWVEVSLAGFEKPDDLIWARLLTASSGVDQKSGLHLTPAKGSTVAVAHSGSFSDSVWVLGNVRREAATTSAPSISSDGTFAFACDEITTESQHWALSGKNIVLKSSGVKVSMDSTKVSVERS
jgi:hypothetical protein